MKTKNKSVKKFKYMQLYKKNKEKHPRSYYQPKGRVCFYCGQSSKTVFVHGHEQCVVCRINVEPLKLLSQITFLL